MKSIRIIVLLALTLFGNWIVAQETDANIFGHVIDKQTHEHLPYVNLVIKGTTKGAPSCKSTAVCKTSSTATKTISTKALCVMLDTSTVPQCQGLTTWD